MNPITQYIIRTEDGDVFDTTDTEEAEDHARDDDARVTAVTTDADAPSAFDRLEHDHEVYRGFGGQA